MELNTIPEAIEAITKGEGLRSMLVAEVQAA
jgi:hypothetical protein